MTKNLLPILLAPGIVFASALALPAVATAQLDKGSTTEIRTHFLADLDSVHVKIMALAETIPAEKYTWSPTPETRTIANALMHVATEWYVYIPMVMGGKPPADFGAPREAIPKLEKLTAKTEVIDHLKKAWVHAKQQVESADLSPLMAPRQMFGQTTTFSQLTFAMSGDLHEHLGQLVTYTRSIGLVPPWSKK